MRALLEAWQYAHDVHHSVVDFAIEIQRLEQLGITNSELRWLICKNYVRHLADVTQRDQDGRELRETKSLNFANTSCFTLTEAGLEYAKSVVTGHVAVPENTNGDTPHWDTKRRILIVGEHVVREFHTRACNQEQILDAFEEQKWPVRIDDPLPAESGTDKKVRLNKAIYRLNHSLNSPHIHFACDGTGSGVCWQFNGANGTADAPKE